MIKLFDLKLVDGSYFKNVDLVDEYSGEIEEVEDILTCCNDLYIYYHVDFDCEDLIAKIKSDDIEYIAKAYKYKENQ